MVDISLEMKLLAMRADSKKYVIKHLRVGTPFQYLINLSKVGEEDYGVCKDDSFLVGVNTALDFYNKYKTPSSSFYGILRGGEEIIRYVHKHAEWDYEEVEE